MSERTYVSGYWPLAMNNKRRIDYYERLLPDSLTPLRGKCLIFFAADECILDLVQAHCRRLDVDLEGRVLPVTALPHWQLADALMASWYCSAATCRNW